MSYSNNKFGLIAVVVLIVTGALVISIRFEIKGRGSEPQAILMQDSTMTLFSRGEQLNQFFLVDHNGNNFNLDQLNGKWTFLFFGYTSCPDICPTTMAALSRTYQNLKQKIKDNSNIQYIFISVDPKRDTTEKLKSYVSYFNKDFIGITGKHEQIQALSKQIGAMHEIVTIPGKDEYYVNHTSSIFLIDPGMRYRAAFTAPHNPDAIAERFLIAYKLD
ncbi:MAG: SCO family protein [Proteobacteria bacterium]|nr:SCO family protein [Pseudomonadota bacterium]